MHGRDGVPAVRAGVGGGTSLPRDVMVAAGLTLTLTLQQAGARIWVRPLSHQPQSAHLPKLGPPPPPTGLVWGLREGDPTMGLQMPSGPGVPWVPLGRQWGGYDFGDGDGLLGLAGSPERLL